MNIRTIIFSGIIAGLIGAMIGLAITRISQRESRAKAIIIGGASLGFIVGVAQESIRQQKDRIDNELGD